MVEYYATSHLYLYSLQLSESPITVSTLEAVGR